MAQKKQQKNKIGLKMPALPKGWKEARTTLAGWFARVPGNTVIGIKRGVFQVDDNYNRGKKRNVYRIEVLDGESPFIGEVDSGEVANTGDVIGLDETGWTKKVGDYEDGQVLRIVYVGKDGDGDKDPHIFQIATPEE